LPKEAKKREKQAKANATKEISTEGALEEEEGSGREPLEKELNKKIEDLTDQLLRTQAEIQNIRRVSSQEVTKARLFGVESLALEFLSVGDNLQRALNSSKEKNDIGSIVEGLELTLKSFEASLESAGVRPVDPEGEIFNPERHEAISIIEDKKIQENSIVEVIQRGFTIQDRILRPARVVVSKKPKKGNSTLKN